MKRLVFGILCLVVSVLPYKTAHAGVVECFLFINGVPGESVDLQHKDQIELQGWSFAEFIPGAVGAASAGSGGVQRAQIQEFRVTARMSKASPILFRLGASGQRLPGAILTCRRAGMKADYLRISLENILVSSYQAGVPGTSSTPFPPPGIPATSFADGIPLDQVGLTFGTITVEYSPVSPTGQLGGVIKGGFDFISNKVK
ncbi:MAG: Hcp family type VI secretion system effector [Candidatus Deferrimicrobiaceae bacterium]